MQKVRTLIAGLACMAVLGLASTASAGTYPQDHNGWSIGFGIGGGSAGLSLDNFEAGDREGGGMGSFRVGYPLNSQVSLGLESNAWTKSETVNGTDATVTFSATTVGAAFFPAEGFVLRGGVGLGQTKFTASQGSVSVSNSETGFGVTYGVGYEFRLARTFALGPQIDGGFATFDGGSSNWVGLGLEFNWYFIPKK
jgi:hypothetical protein